MGKQMQNGCVIDALTDLLGEDGWDVDGVIEMIRENGGNGVPVNRVKELADHAPIVVHADTDPAYYISGKNGIIRVGSDVGEYVLDGSERVVIVAPTPLEEGNYHAVCLRANDLVVLNHVNAFIHKL